MKLTSVWCISRVPSWRTSLAYVVVVVLRDLESCRDRHVLLLEPSRGWLLYHALDLDLDPCRLVGGCLERQNALCQAPLLRT